LLVPERVDVPGEAAESEGPVVEGVVPRAGIEPATP
jgi:hypothetical protein